MDAVYGERRVGQDEGSTRCGRAAHERVSDWVGLFPLEPRLLLSAAGLDFGTDLALAATGDNPAVVVGATDPNGLLAAKGGPLAKINTMLAMTFAEHQAYASGDRMAPFLASDPFIDVSDGLVVIDAVASDDVGVLLADLESLGLVGGETFGAYVSGRLPLEAVSDMAALASLRSASAGMRPWTNAGPGGSVISQGDEAMRADHAREAFGVDGTGVTVGVVSDSIQVLKGGAGYAADVASGDLPEGIMNIGPSTQGSDEGRALMQLVHDVAPGAQMAFHTAAGGSAAMANGILELAAHGADIIIDDVIYLDEPMFQDGIIAQAVDMVVDQGVAYFSSAGNTDRMAYEAPYRTSRQPLTIDGQYGGELHSFSSGRKRDALQEITIPVGWSVFLIFQWDTPFGAVETDMDIYLTDASGEELLAGSSFDNILSGVPQEMLAYVNRGGYGTEFNLAISNYAGPDPGLMKYVMYVATDTVTINEYDTASGTVYGHANAAGAMAVGAAFYNETPEFGQDPPLLEPYSSGGPTPILFDAAGIRLAKPEIRQHPEIVAPDGVNTTFFGKDIPEDEDSLPNFFGTSAAVPHVAGVAALMLELEPSLTPDEVYTILEDTALDMAAPGLDYDTGHGLVQADMALLAIASTTGPELSVEADGENVTLTWSDTLDGQGGFQIERAKKPKGKKGGEPKFDVIATVGPGETTFTDSPGKGTWVYRVRGVVVRYALDPGNEVEVILDGRVDDTGDGDADNGDDGDDDKHDGKHAGKHDHHKRRRGHRREKKSSSACAKAVANEVSAVANAQDVFVDLLVDPLLPQG